MNDRRRTVAVVTTSRADYSYYRPVMSAIQSSTDLGLRVIVGGMHLSPRFGSTVNAIEQDGFPISDRIEMVMTEDTPASIANSMSAATTGMSQALGRERPDLLLLLGDRFEMLAVAAAALPFAIPIAHIGGGESTYGAMDDSARHAITKLSHLHFVQTPMYRDRVIQMGEEPWRVFVAGAASLDNLRGFTPLTRALLEERVGMDLQEPPLVVTFHPATLEAEQSSSQVAELLAALEVVNDPVVFTAPNADPDHHAIQRAIQQYVAAHGNARLVTSLGTEAYFSLLRLASAMVGNSSSGIIEAASFELPVVNVGSRQEGRVHDRNVITVACARDAIERAIRTARSSEFRDTLRGLRNPYGDGRAAETIVHTLRTIDLGPKLLMKRFHQIVSS